MITLFIISIFYTIYKLYNPVSKYKITDNNITGIITDISSDNRIVLKAKENIIVYYNKKININLGDKVNIIGNLSPLLNNTIPNTFNYKKYM